MNKKDWKREIFTIPNFLSLLRLALIPVYMTLYLNAKTDRDYYIAAVVLAVSCLTDLLDGKIARYFNMITSVGKVLDPLADKLTQFTVMLCLAVRFSFLWYLVVFFFIKEIFQLVAGYVSLKKGRMLKGALMAGKISTTVLFISLVLLVMLPRIPEHIVMIIGIVDGIFLLVAFVDYILAYFLWPEKFNYFEKK